MIQLLDPSTIDKIAAGEVVERPAAVVKELVENAIDAGANAITVEIKEGGISFIRITDNGCGIAREEIPMAFTRHATSKIKNIEDLLTIHSLGFRGKRRSRMPGWLHLFDKEFVLQYTGPSQIFENKNDRRRLYQ